MNKLPDFFIVGVQKAGTTSISEYLDQHPGCGISVIKEPCFFAYYGIKEEDVIYKLINFNRGVPSFDIITNISEYSNLFPSKKIVGDASTHYFYFYDRTIQNIKKFYGDKYKDIKIIICLRDPVERAFSAWSMFIRDDKEHRPFLKALRESRKTFMETKIVDYDYVGFSLYSEGLEAFLTEFKHVKIMFFDDLKKDPLSFMKEIYLFLGVNHTFKPDVSIKLNISGKPKSKIFYKFLFGNNPIKNIVKPLIPEKNRKKIRSVLQKKLLSKPRLRKEEREEALSYFIEDIEKVEKILDKNLSSWKNI